jgi:hypothetical protein
VAPRSALQWRAGFPAAVLNLELKRGRDKPSEEGEAELRRAIGRAPLQPLGYRLMARRAQLEHKVDRAALLYGLAVARGPRDLQSLAWAAKYELASGDFASALSRFDQMMRVQPEASHHFAPMLLAVAAHAPAQRDFVRLLQKHPPWREEFMGRLISKSRSLAPIAPLVERLRTTKPGLTEKELAAWIARLAANGQWGSAYLIWVQSLPPEASQRIGNLYNGGFELEPSQSGFDWIYRSVPGVRISRAQVAGTTEAVALRLEFEDRRIKFPKVQQLLALAPGSYLFRGRVRLDDLRSERGLVWALDCVGGGGHLGESEAFSGRREWRQFEVHFTVPESSCGGQLLSLRLPARVPAENRIGGVAWFDDLSIKAE